MTVLEADRFEPNPAQSESGVGKTIWSDAGSPDDLKPGEVYICTGLPYALWGLMSTNHETGKRHRWTAIPVTQMEF
jgi:hypothetical protein